MICWWIIQENCKKWWSRKTSNEWYHYSTLLQAYLIEPYCSCPTRSSGRLANVLLIPGLITLNNSWHSPTMDYDFNLNTFSPLQEFFMESFCPSNFTHPSTVIFFAQSPNKPHFFILLNISYRKHAVTGRLLAPTAGGGLRKKVGLSRALDWFFFSIVCGHGPISAVKQAAILGFEPLLIGMK